MATGQWIETDTPRWWFDSGALSLDFGHSPVETVDELAAWLGARFDRLGDDASERDLVDALALRAAVNRLARAQANLMETLPLFVAALLACAVAGRLGPRTLLGAQLFFWGRLVYLPLYAAGVAVARSLAWGVALLGLVLILWTLLIG